MGEGSWNGVTRSGDGDREIRLGVIISRLGDTDIVGDRGGIRLGGDGFARFR